MGRKTAKDWEAIEREYRAGQLSVREIGDRFDINHAAIIRRAKKEGWSRDLTDAVRTEVQSRLSTPDPKKVTKVTKVTSGYTRGDQEIIDEAASRAVDVVLAHRQRLNNLHIVSDILTDKCVRFLNGEEPVIIVPGIKIGEDEQGNKKEIFEEVRIPFLGDHESIAQVMAKIAQTLAKTIPQERKAFNLDDKEGQQETVIFAPQVIKKEKDAGI